MRVGRNWQLRPLIENECGTNGGEVTWLLTQEMQGAEVRRGPGELQESAAASWRPVTGNLSATSELCGTRGTQFVCQNGVSWFYTSGEHGLLTEGGL